MTESCAVFSCRRVHLSTSSASPELQILVLVCRALQCGYHAQKLWSHTYTRRLVIPQSVGKLRSLKNLISEITVIYTSVRWVLLKFPHRNSRPLRFLAPNFLYNRTLLSWVTRHAIHRYVFKYAISQIIHVRSLDSQINQTFVPNQVHQDYLYGQRYGSIFCIWIYHGLPRQWAYRTRKTVPT